MRKIALILFYLISFLNSFSQCINEDKISSGGDWDNYHFTYFCPTYEFSFGGDTSKTWNVVNDEIDINQISNSVFPIKQKVEVAILKYAGKRFFKKLKFISVEVVYPDSIEKFSGRSPFCNLDSCRSKYFFYYSYSPVEKADYHIGIAANEYGEIQNRFDFPGEKNFRTIDSTLTIC